MPENFGILMWMRAMIPRSHVINRWGMLEDEGDHRRMDESMLCCREDANEGVAEQDVIE